MHPGIPKSLVLNVDINRQAAASVTNLKVHTFPLRVDTKSRKVATKSASYVQNLALALMHF